MSFVRYTVRNARPVQQRLKAFNVKVSRQYTPGLIKSANRIGEIWKASYAGEGSSVGGWPDLTEVTQDIREQQGFPREHPIMIRSGALRRVVTDRVVEAKSQGSWTQTDNYVHKPTTLKISGGNGRPLTLRAFGWKVSNQEEFKTKAPPGRGSSSRKSVTVPPRPFWFVDEEVNAAAMRGFEEWLETEIKRV